MRILWLYGVNCTEEIWEDVIPVFSNDENIIVTYPHVLCETAKCVEDLSEWVADTYASQSFDAIVAHSMGGIIALQLVTLFGIQTNCIVMIETNLCPAKPFYRNLLYTANEERLKERITKMINKESKHYREELLFTLQEDFDYSGYVSSIACSLYGIYGDRGQNEYENRIQDLNLAQETIEQIQFIFIKNCCHMPMLENAKELTEILQTIL